MAWGRRLTEADVWFPKGTLGINVRLVKEGFVWEGPGAGVKVACEHVSSCILSA